MTINPGFTLQHIRTLMWAEREGCLKNKLFLEIFLSISYLQSKYDLKLYKNTEYN